MSWPAAPAYPPPPRRSRSRSPRGSYPPPRPPHPDSAYSQDPYRSEWDAYDRERAWAQYERDRVAYEYRRGRSRSPPLDDTNRKRRRSLSPWDRDRYEPRPRYSDDYDTHSRGYGYTSPRRGHPAPFAPSRRAPPDPHTFDYPASLKQYAEWFRYFYPQQATEEDNADKAAEQEAGDGSKPRNGIKSKWEKYKKDFAASQLQTMFDHHKKSPWFGEKYDPSPEFQQLRMRVRKEGWRGRISTFLLDLESGKFDPDFSDPQPEPASPTKENATNGESTPVEANGAAPLGADEPKAAGGDDDMQFNVDAEEEAGDTDAARADTTEKQAADSRRLNNRGEEISVPPEGNQVMIRTIPPDIGRIKLEEACGKVPGFMYLALGDPLQKRNYYRAGWLRFRDDADMSVVMSELSEKKIEGFKLHVTHNLRPFVNRIRYAPEVASKPDRLAKDLSNARALVTILEDEAAMLRKFKVEKKESAVNAEGNSGETDTVMDDGTSGVDVDEPEPKEKGSDAVERRIVKVLSDLREQNRMDPSDEWVYETKKTEISLDLYIAYLRAAFHTCYYCSVVTDHIEELQRKCLKHERKPLSPAMLDEIKQAETSKSEKDKADSVAEAEGKNVATDEDKEKEKEKEKTKKDGHGKDKSNESRDWKRNDERWIEWLDSKMALLINRSGVDPRDYGGKSYDEELTKAVDQYVKQEDEGKFRCKTCQKLFKATSFVEKHIANKHPELVKHLDEIPYFNNFALDPHRIQAFAHPPPPVGNNQAPPPQAWGIPAGHHNAGEYGRPGPYSGQPFAQPGYPPPYPYNNYWDGHASYAGGAGYGAPPAPYPSGPPPRRDEATTARRLSERISGYASESPLVPVPGLPAKPSPAALDTALVAGNTGSSGGGPGRRNGRNGGGGPPPPPPPDAKEDPRAAAGKRVSYHDMDLVAEGDVELNY